jgi:hypothetical protein
MNGREYDLALSEIGSDHNNIIYCLNEMGQWRKMSGINATAMLSYFQVPYFVDAVNGSVYRYDQGDTDFGSAINMDVRWKAFDFKRPENNKILWFVYLSGINTGATYQVWVSYDDGVTFTELVDEGGTTSYVSSTDNSSFTRRFTQSMSGSTIQGRTVMLRVTSSDIYPAIVKNIRAELFVRKGPTLSWS